MAIDKIKIGNVQFDSADVAKSSVVYKNGEKLNCVFLKDGTKLTFKDQDNPRASVQTGRDMGTGRDGTGFSNIKGLTIEGTEKPEYYHLFNCDDPTVNVEAGGDDIVRVAHKTPQQKGTITADSNDKVEFVDVSKMMSMSEGWFTKIKEEK